MVYTNYLHTKGLLYYQRCLSFHSFMQAKIGELLLQTRLTVYFSNIILYIRKCTSLTWISKLQVVIRFATDRTTPLLMKTFLVWFIVIQEIRLESNCLRHSSWYTVVLWSHIVCIHQAHTYFAVWSTTTRDNKSHFTATHVLLYRTKFYFMATAIPAVYSSCLHITMTFWWML